MKAIMIAPKFVTAARRIPVASRRNGVRFQVEKAFRPCREESPAKYIISPESVISRRGSLANSRYLSARKFRACTISSVWLS